MVETEERGDILIRGFWKGGSDCIVDISVSDTDAPSYVNPNWDPIKILSDQEKAKKH